MICIIEALAIAAETNPKRITKLIGHKGIHLFKSHRVGVNLEELKDVCLKMGFAPVHIARYPVTMFPDCRHKPACMYKPYKDDSRFWKLASRWNCVHIGYYNGKIHAVAGVKGVCYDPNGYDGRFQNHSFESKEAILLIPADTES